ncbi:MAG: hypothetical protein GQ565_01490 [Candidatus Aegiribacteria sp.]|nr:hypothetical protein [Candidatus Aegiribacteria sp.]
MKKLGLILLVAGIVLMAGCAGDDPAGPSGTLADVTGLTINTSSSGRNVDMSWNAVDDVDGYKVYFRETTTADWIEGADVTSGTSGTHVNATSAGYYTVKAYKGTNTSANNSNVENTLPTVVSTTYTIYDNYSIATQPSGFIFGETSGQTGSAISTSFKQDIYAFDEDAPLRGDNTVRLYSGTLSPYGNGNTTHMAEPAAAGYCELYGTGSWYPNYGLYAGDVRVFLHLQNGHYVKMYNIVVTPDPATTNGTMVSFSYEIQTDGLTLFTSN